MKSWQKDIYYIAGESIESLKNSPFLETANRKGVEVLYLVDPIDEYAIQNMADFDGHKLQSLTKEGVKFGDEDESVTKKRVKLYKESFKPLTKYLKDLLGGKISKVTVSQRVETSPCIIVSSLYGHSANMERIMRAQTFSDSSKIAAMTGTKNLELNPRHPMIVELNKLVAESPDAQSTKDIRTNSSLLPGFKSAAGRCSLRKAHVRIGRKTCAMPATPTVRRSTRDKTRQRVGDTTRRTADACGC
jgi:HSP90 family molecular chaperone